MKKLILNLFLALVVLGGFCHVNAEGDDPIGDVIGAVGEVAGGAVTFFERDILAGPGKFLNRTVLDPSGLTLGGGITNVYQQTARGGNSTHDGDGRFAGSYDIEIAGDLQKLLGIKGGIYMLIEGSWPKTGGIDDHVGSSFGVNGDASGSRTMDVTQLWYEHAFFDETLTIRAGKLDMGGTFECRGCPVAFDGNLFANDQTAQFLNGGLVNNPTVPLPDEGLGVIFYYNPSDMWYAAFGLIDAQSDRRETGIKTTFRDEDYFLYMFETGCTPQFESANGPLQGAYRVGLWVDGQDKDRFSTGKKYRDDMGMYISCDQMVCKESADADDTQGLGVFGRFGYASSDRNAIANFWSLGCQYQGLLDGRDDDVLGVGIAQGIYSDRSGENVDANDETAYEIYYNVAINDTLNISPSLQYIENPGGTNANRDAVVLALRAQLSF